MREKKILQTGDVVDPEMLLALSYRAWIPWGAFVGKEEEIFFPRVLISRSFAQDLAQQLAAAIREGAVRGEVREIGGGSILLAFEGGGNDLTIDVKLPNIEFY